jgi:hypothetical protein
LTNPQVKPPKSARITIVEDGLTPEERASHKAMNAAIRAAAGMVPDDEPSTQPTGMNAFLRQRGVEQNPPARLKHVPVSLAGRQRALLDKLFKHVKPDKEQP